MKNLIAILFLFFYNTLMLAQDTYKPPRFTKTAVSNSGCFAYLPGAQDEYKFDESFSQDSSKVYTGDFMHGGYHFALIVVKLKDELNSKDNVENVAIAYLDYLKDAFDIDKSTGYGKGHTMESNPNAIGIIDYWEDKEKNVWAIKTWADKSTIGVMMLYGPKEYPNFNVQSMYLDGFRFK